MSLRSNVYFGGFGGDTVGWEQVPGLTGQIYANHSDICVQVHELNFPEMTHLPPGDVRDIDLASLPYAELFWGSPACPAWTDAAGKKRHFDQSNQYSLIEDSDLGLVIDDPAESRSRSLIEQIPRYLRAMAARGTPVLGGVMENVIQCRRWDRWAEWLRSIEEIGPGYNVRVIALNSMHAMPRLCAAAPQSRDRLYVAYTLKSLGRTPDWDKWLRPKAYCRGCDRVVDAVQSWKKPGADMGRYGAHGQYVYRCPSISCRNTVVEPFTTPASTAIDWSLDPGAVIADRDKPLAPATMERIRIGLARYTNTVADGDGAVEAMLVQTSKRSTQPARPVSAPMPTQTTRRELGVAVLPPFLTSLRGGGSKNTTYGIDEPLSTFSASGFHHGLVGPPQERADLLVPYYSTGVARPVTEPMGTLTTRDRYGVLGVEQLNRIAEQCTFRMLDIHEIRDGMAFPKGFKMIGDKRTRARGLGNAVTPPVSEILGCALVETITGEDIERFAA